MQHLPRINELDIIRGAALLGILIVNMGLFSFPALYQNPLEHWTGWIDKATLLSVNFIGEGKFISMFSFLFGLGFTIFIDRAQHKKGGATRLFVRRLLVLLGIGIIHSFFIWYGDVLCIYSMGGFFLLLFRNSKPKALLRTAFSLLLVPVLLAIMMTLTGGSDLSAEPSYASAGDEAVSVYQSGSLSDLFSRNNKDQLVTKAGYLFIFPQILAMFLFGAYAGKKQIFRQVPLYRQRIKHICRVSLAIGLPVAITSLVYSYGSPLGPAYMLTQITGSYIGGAALGIFYISALLLLLQKTSWQQILWPLAAVGRMAATNYLLQSVICICIFYSFGLGLYSKTRPVAGLGIVVGLFIFQIIASNWWMRYFCYGPVEWLWRTLTYGQRVPIRKPVTKP